MGIRDRLIRLKKRRDKLTEKVNDAALHTHGGTQTCPWCKQCAQTRGDWHFDQCKDDPMLDELTCGTCGGTSIWLFTICMIYIRPGKPPVPLQPSVTHANQEPNND